MSNRVLVSAGTNPGRMYLQFIARQNEALAMGQRIKAVLDKAQHGDPADWAAVAAELGIVGVNAAQIAQDAWTLLSTAMASIDSAPVRELLSRTDQG
jgi:hypothetical protein